MFISFFSLQTMPALNYGRHALERSPCFRNIEKKSSTHEKRSNKHTKRVYPLSIDKSPSCLVLSSLSSSQNSNDSSLNCSTISSGDAQGINHVFFHGLFGSLRRRDYGSDGVEYEVVESQNGVDDLIDELSLCVGEDGIFKRCNWITKSSDEVYVSFHDKCWGVPVFSDCLLFELLTLSGLLIDHSWTEILKRQERYREVFMKFDHMAVAKMDEKRIKEISSDKEMILAESRIRCIIDNAMSMQKVVEEFGSFSCYIWSLLNYTPIINKYKYPRSIPIRTPKSEALSKDLVRRGFRLVGPVIIYSFMQAAGMAIDHQTNCFRFRECARLAQR